MIKKQTKALRRRLPFASTSTANIDRSESSNDADSSFCFEVVSEEDNLKYSLSPGMVYFASEYFEILIIEENFKYQILLKTLVLITSIKLKNQIALSEIL